MSRVVYLMGAGASYGKRDENDKKTILEGLPIVNEIPDRLEYVNQVISEINFSGNLNVDTSRGNSIDLQNSQKELSNDFKWLQEEVKKHATIDTFAKKLFLTGQFDLYEKLKRLLCLFFMTEQLINRPDSRYDTFLANTLQKNEDKLLRINSDISILTWNYDMQFEIAYKYYLGEKAIDFPDQIGIYLYNKLEKDFRNSVNDIYPVSEYRQIFKLNGSAYFSANYSIAKWYSYNDGRILEERARGLLSNYMDSYPNSGEKIRCYLNFAWDKQDNSFDSEYYTNLEDSISDAEILVIIGYTFPFFNRETDKRILAMMGRLNHIYIQDPNANILRSSIIPILHQNHVGIKIDTITNVDQFFIPPEL